jgi:uncharacterized protein (UPF0332 family)
MAYMILFRLEMARGYLNDAEMLFHGKRFNSAASRAYYAAYQAMWAALGEPEDGKIWRHLAIIKHFVRGYWYRFDHPETGPGLLEDKRLPLRRLYSYRIRSDYDGAVLDRETLKDLLGMVGEIILLVQEKGRCEDARR